MPLDLQESEFAPTRSPLAICLSSSPTLVRVITLVKQDGPKHIRSPIWSPPEVFFLDGQKNEYALSFSSEIWTLGCTIFEIIGSWGPFDTFGGVGILEDQVSVLGKLPDSWWSQWESRAGFFNEDATIDVRTGTPVQESLQKRYDELVNGARRWSDMEEQGSDEKRAFLHMIGTMLRYSPTDRATIQDVIESEWMQKWAFPAKQDLVETSRAC